MNHSELTRELAAELGESDRYSQFVLDSLLRVMGRSIVRGETIVLTNFGTLRPLQGTSRSYGPGDSTEGSKPAAVRVKFKPADKLLEAVKEGNDRVCFRKTRGRLPRPS